MLPNWVIVSQHLLIADHICINLELNQTHLIIQYAIEKVLYSLPPSLSKECAHGHLVSNIILCTSFFHQKVGELAKYINFLKYFAKT